MTMTPRNRFALLALVATMLAAPVRAADKAPAKASPVSAGQYACVFGFGGTFFDTNPLTIAPDNRYRSTGGEGTFSYSAAARQIKFLTGVLARDFTTAAYVPSGPVQGGLKNKKGPAIVLKPSASYKKIHGDEAVPLYCYLRSSK